MTAPPLVRAARRHASTAASAPFTCFPANPPGARTAASEVKSTGLELGEGTVERRYVFRARQGTPAQAEEFVSTHASPAGTWLPLDIAAGVLGVARPAIELGVTEALLPGSPCRARSPG